jgi:hypothetical protein
MARTCETAIMKIEHNIVSICDLSQYRQYRYACTESLLTINTMVRSRNRIRKAVEATKQEKERKEEKT